jgi:hypothetical protein
MPRCLRADPPCDQVVAQGFGNADETEQVDFQVGTAPVRFEPLDAVHSRTPLSSFRPTRRFFQFSRSTLSTMFLNNLPISGRWHLSCPSATEAGRFRPVGKLGKRRISMKNKTLIVASLCVAIGLTVVSAYAQAGGLQAKVPFNFTVLGKTFPAGEYTMIAASHQVRIEDGKGRLVAMVLANDISGRSARATGQIIFHCYSDRCFLSELRSPVQDNGRQLLVSRSEAHLAKEERGKYFAVLGEKPRQ